MIGLALYEEQGDIDNKTTQKESTFKFLEKSVLAKSKRSLEFLFDSRLFSSSSKNSENLIKNLSEAITVLSTESYKLLAEWVLDYSQQLLKIKFKIEGHLSPSSKTEKEKTTGTTDEDDKAKCSTSKSKNENAQLDEQVLAEQKRHHIAETRRAKIMAKLNQMQKNFIENNKEFYDETKTVSQAQIFSSCSSESDMGSMNYEESEYS